MRLVGVISDPHTHDNRCWWSPDEARWVCGAATADRPASVASASSPDLGDCLVDVRDMTVVHTALLREFRLAPAAVRRVADSDRKQAVAVEGHVGLLCDLLHHHHAGEDALLWPRLRDRVPVAATALIDQAQAQHEEIDAALHRVGQTRDRWVRHPDDTTAAVVATELEGLHRLLSEHLDMEERSLLPLAASTLTEEEWHAIGEAAVAAIPKPVLVLVFGMFAYEADPAVLRDMLRTAPGPARFVLPRLAPRVYARRAARVHGTRQP